MVACAGGHQRGGSLFGRAEVRGPSGDRPSRAHVCGQPASAAGVYTETALTNAAAAGCLRSVRILLDGGASVDAAPNSWAPLHARSGAKMAMRGNQIASAGAKKARSRLGRHAPVSPRPIAGWC